MDFQNFKGAFTARFPLRPAHTLRLPQILLHHTTSLAGSVRGDEFYTKLWSGGLWLARYILKHPDEFKGKNVLDVGAGTAVGAIAAARAGAHVTSIDDSREAVYAAQINAQANGVAITTRQADWDSYKEYGAFDVIISADTIYAGFGKVIPKLLKSRKITLYVADRTGWQDQEEIDALQASIARNGGRITYLKKKHSFTECDGIYAKAVTALKISNVRPTASAAAKAGRR